MFGTNVKIPASAIFKLSSCFFGGAFFLLFIDGLFPQMQLMLFSKVLVQSVALKGVFAISLLAMFLLRPQKLPASVFILWICFVSYLILDSIYLMLVCGSSPLVIAYGINSYYFYLLLVPLLPVLRYLDRDLFEKIFFVLGIPLIFFGIYQHIENSNIIPIYSSAGKSVLQNFYGAVRAVSLFKSAVLCSIYYSSFFILNAERLSSASINKYEKGLRVCLGIAAAFGVYFTYTRVAYLVFLVSVSAYFVFRIFPKIRESHRNIMTLLGVNFVISFFLLAGVFAFARYVSPPSPAYVEYERNRISAIVAKIGKYNSAVFKYYQSDVLSAVAVDSSVRFTHSAVVKSDSFASRIIEWTEFSKFSLVRFDTFLFGMGVIQTDRIAGFEGLYIDNLYLNVLLQNGAFGVFFSLMLCLAIWRYAVRLSEPFLVSPLVYVLLTIPITSLFGFVLADYLLFSVVLYIGAGGDVGALQIKSASVPE